MWRIFTSKNIVMANKNFVLLLLGKLTTQIGNWIYFLALIYFVNKLSGSVSYVSIVLFLDAAICLTLATVAGSVCDRFSRKKVLVCCDLMSGILCLIMGVRALFGNITLYEVYIITVLLAITKTFFSPALKSLIPNIVKEEELNRANSLIQSTNSITSILGPFLGGILIATISIPFAFIINGISYILSAISEMFIEVPYEQEKVREDTIAKNIKRIFQDTVSGIKFINSNQTIKSIMYIFSFMTFFAAPMVLIFQQLVERYYSMNSVALGILMIADAIGTLLAGLYLTIRPIVKRQKEFIAIFPIFCGIALIIIGNVLNFYVAVITMFIQGFISGFGEISLITIFQKETTDDKRGMIFSLYSMIINVLTPISLIMSGFILEKATITLVLTICGIALILSSMYMILNLVKKNKEVVKEY